MVEFLKNSSESMEDLLLKINEQAQLTQKYETYFESKKNLAIEPGIHPIRYLGPGPKRIKKKRLRKKIEKRARLIVQDLFKRMHEVCGL